MAHDTDYIDSIWKGMKDNLTICFHIPENVADNSPQTGSGTIRNNFVKIYECLYTNCEKIREALLVTPCRHRCQIEYAWLCELDTILFEKFKEFFVSYCAQDEGEYIRNAISNSSDVLLKYQSFWFQYCSNSMTLCRAYLHLRSYFIIPNRNRLVRTQKNVRESEDGKKLFDKIYFLAVGQWRDLIFVTLEEQITSASLEIIKKERDGEEVGFSIKKLVKDVIASYVEVGKTLTEDGEIKSTFYQETIEKRFLEETERLYAQFFEFNSLSQNYLQETENFLKNERNRVRWYFAKCTLPKLESAIVLNFLYKLSARYIRMGDEENLKEMNRTLAERPDLPAMSRLFEVHCDEEVTEVIEKCTADPSEYICEFVSIYHKFRCLAKTAFDDSVEFLVALDKTFGKLGIMEKAPNLLVKYCDSLMVKDAEMLPGETLDTAMHNVVIVFYYLENKIEFQELYLRSVMGRFVKNTSADINSEEELISRLSDACCFQYAFKFECLFRDVKSSIKLSHDFNKFMTRTSPLEIEFNVQIWSEKWPLKRSESITLPEKMDQYLGRFTDFYDTATSSEKKILQWLHNMSTGEMEVKCFGEPFTLSATLYQMVVIMQFNKKTSWSIEELAQATMLKPELLTKVVKSIVNSKLLYSVDRKTAFTKSSVISLPLKYLNEKPIVDIIGFFIKEDLKDRKRKQGLATQAVKSRF